MEETKGGHQDDEALLGARKVLARCLYRLAGLHGTGRAVDGLGCTCSGARKNPSTPTLAPPSPDAICPIWSIPLPSDAHDAHDAHDVLDCP